jgi:hypothetical protein
MGLNIGHILIYSGSSCQWRPSIKGTGPHLPLLLTKRMIFMAFFVEEKM